MTDSYNKTNNIKEIKTSIRKRNKKLRAAIPAEEKKSYDEAIFKRFVSLCSYRFSSAVFLYYPLKDEISTLNIFHDAVKKGKTVAFPRCTDGNNMVYHAITSLDQLRPGKYGIMEPDESLPVFEGDKNTVCVLPAIAYDKRGYRLGYGKGYYDRYLSTFKGVKAGLLYSSLMLEQIPNGKYDLRSDVLITEKGVISFAKN